MSKIHLQRNKAANGQAPVAVCATNPYLLIAQVGGRVPRNSRNSYQFMASEIKPIAEFRNVPAADRCAHCMDMGLVLRNKLRAQNGQAPVACVTD